MTQLATRSNKLTSVLAFEVDPEYGYARKAASVNVVAGMDIGAVVQNVGGTYQWVSATDISGLAAPVQSALSTLTTGGTLPATTAYFYVVTALNNAGETIKSNEQTVTTGATATNSITVSWAAITGATGYKVYRGTATGVETVFYAVGAVTTFVDTGAASTAGTPPAANSTTLLADIAVIVDDYAGVPTLALTPAVYTVSVLNRGPSGVVQGGLKFAGVTVPSAAQLATVYAALEKIGVATRTTV